MRQPTVSVIIPAYNQADYLGEAIQSVLDQTYPNFELIIVNDASPDHTDEVVKQYDDPRLKYIVHQQNRHLAATRNTGIRASTGEIIALLDADDRFHPKKLEAHVTFLEKHPEIGVTYNTRFEIDSSGQVLWFWRPPLVATFSDLVLGFPFGPSDMVVRRDWLFQIDLFDESYVHFSEDLDINCRLAAAGCQFASVDQALNYRRYYPGRIIKDVSDRLTAAIRALERAFADPNCPNDVSALRSTALGTTYMIWSYEAFILNETTLGQELIRKAIQLDPSILDNNPSKFLEFLIFRSNQDGSDHEVFLRRVFAQLPPELGLSSQHTDEALARGYLIRGTRDIIWERFEQSKLHFARATELRTEIDESFIQLLTYQLLAYENEFGMEATQAVIRRLAPYFRQLGGGRRARQLKGSFSINRAFQSYRAGEYAQVPGEVMRAVTNDPKYLFNWGVLSILLRSIAAPPPHLEAM
jgi:glycosyltransferase involved in cell wall biosynthesis